MKRTFFLLLILTSFSIFANKVNIQKLYDSGINSIVQGNYEQGIIKLRTVYLSSPRCKLAEKARFYVGYFAPDIFQQKVEYTAFLRSYPHSSLREKVYFNLGLNSYVMENYQSAEKYFEKYLWDYPTGKYTENVNFYLAVIAYKNQEYDVFETKLRKIVNNKNSKFRDNSIYLLKNYYKKKGILEKVKELNNLLSNTFPLSIRSDENRYFTIQLGAFRKKSGAERLREILIKKHYKDTNIKELNGYYKVFYGVFLTKEECEFYYNKLKKIGYKGKIIEKNN